MQFSSQVFHQHLTNALFEIFFFFKAERSNTSLCLSNTTVNAHLSVVYKGKSITSRSPTDRLRTIAKQHIFSFRSASVGILFFFMSFKYLSIPIGYLFKALFNWYFFHWLLKFSVRFCSMYYNDMHTLSHVLSVHILTVAQTTSLFIYVYIKVN